MIYEGTYCNDKMHGLVREVMDDHITVGVYRHGDMLAQYTFYISGMAMKLGIQQSLLNDL